MSQQPLSNRILAGALTFVGLGVVWIAIVNSLPSEQELAVKEASLSPRTVAAKPPAEATLDLSIPGVAAVPPIPAVSESSATGEMPSTSKVIDSHAAQVSRLRCEAEIEQMCPDSFDGVARRQCLEQHAQQLPEPCRVQVRQRLVKWREERSRATAACQADIKRFCSKRPGAGALQCLQQHAQELSDGCYERLPKGALYFKQ